MKILVLGSRCAVSDDLMDMVKNLADSLGLDYTIEKTENEADMKTYDVSINCMYGYCPGCVHNHEGSNEKNTPALVVDGKLVFHSRLPEEEMLAQILLKK